MVCIWTMVLLISGVSYADVKDKPVASLTVLSLPQRVVYDVGENVDLYGMRVKVVFTDGEESTVGYEDLTYDGYNPQQEGSQLIVAKYGDNSVPFSVTVQRGSLREISVKLKTTMNPWVAGYVLSKDNFTVTADYDVGSTLEVTDYVFNPNTLSVGRNNITVSYHEKAATVIIDARENSCQSLHVETPGTEEFQLGEPFNWKGLKVTGHFLDGSDRDVTSDCKIKGAVTNRKGTQYVEVTYKDKIVTYPVNVIVKVFDHLDASKWESDGVVAIYYKDKNDPIYVDKNLVRILDDNKAGIRTVIVTYAGKTYQTNIDIPKEERRYINSKHILISVPIRVNIVTNESGELGYMKKTIIQSLTDIAMSMRLSTPIQVPKLSGLPTVLTVPKESSVDLALDISNEPYAETKAHEYYMINSELEVH